MAPRPLTRPLFPHRSSYDIRIADGTVGEWAVAAVAVGKWETRSVFQGGEAAVFSTAFFPAHFARELLRRPVPQTAVWPLSIVFGSPIRDLPPRFEQIPKPAYTQTFVPQLAVETLHAPVLHRPPRLDMHQLDLPLDAPRLKMTAGQFRPVVAANRRGHSALGDDRFQHPRHSPAGKTRIYFQGQTLSRVRVHHAEHPALLQINRIEQINILIDNLAGGNAAQSALEHIPGAELPPGIVDARDAGIDALESIRSMNNSQIDLLLEQLQASAP